MFAGRVTPEQANVTVPEITIDVEEDRFLHSLSISIKSSQVMAIAVVDDRVDSVFTIRNQVEHFVGLITDTFAYLTGFSYAVTITSVLSPDSKHHVFDVNVDAVSEKTDFENLDATFNEIMAVYSTPAGDPLKRCMADFRRSLRNPEDSGFFCYRAVESLRHYFADDTDDDPGWETMRSQLDVAREDLMFIKQFADPRRHGTTAPITDDERAEVYSITWKVIDSYISHAQTEWHD